MMSVSSPAADMLAAPRDTTLPTPSPDQEQAAEALRALLRRGPWRFHKLFEYTTTRCMCSLCGLPTCEEATFRSEGPGREWITIDFSCAARLVHHIPLGDRVRWRKRRAAMKAQRAADEKRRLGRKRLEDREEFTLAYGPLLREVEALCLQEHRPTAALEFWRILRAQLREFVPPTRRQLHTHERLLTGKKK